MTATVDKKVVFGILGIVNYLDKFIGHKADIQEPISQLINHFTTYQPFHNLSTI